MCDGAIVNATPRSINRDDDRPADTVQTRIFPVILSGGSGARLWPLSREAAPKQLIRLMGGPTLFQETLLRATDEALLAPLTVITGMDNRFLIAEQLREIGAREATIVLEPMPRNTAPAAAIAALLTEEFAADGLLLLMPADHWVSDQKTFLDTLSTAVPLAKSGYLTLFGIRPDRPATGYGYIRAAPPARDLEGSRTATFVEKPDLARAESYVASGNCLWNSGIVLASASTLLGELEIFEPELLSAARLALDRASRDADFLRLDPEAFARCRSISLDYAVLERSERLAVVPATFGWRDIGSWSSLWEIASRDENGNAIFGDVVEVATTNSYIRSEGSLVATIGVDNLIVVATGDAVLVADMADDQEIRKVVEILRRRGDNRV